jgi:hypothetical protein
MNNISCSIPGIAIKFSVHVISRAYWSGSGVLLGRWSSNRGALTVPPLNKLSSLNVGETLKMEKILKSPCIGILGLSSTIV